MTLKEKLKTLCVQRLNDKVEAFQGIVDDLSAGAQSDAKSSAGDKHETALSMMHLEQENISSKIRESLELLEVVSKVDEAKKSEVVEFGSIVRLNSVYLFLSSALPKVDIDDISILPISVDAPIAKMAMGRKMGDTFTFNNNEFTIHFLE
ncbi:MAG: hypothetical protein LBI72_00355 [Flavobacteriaceae bacterium]|jgi:transcription elongation GreA/GreB family factor|nr:hypothetical protein [Flavobacteriaceae bacterium]